MFLTFGSTSFFLKLPKKTGFWTPFISEGVASAPTVYSRVCQKTDLESVDWDAFFRCFLDVREIFLLLVIRLMFVHRSKKKVMLFRFLLFFEVNVTIFSLFHVY